MAFAKFPDGADFTVDESMARHMAVGDYLEVPSQGSDDDFPFELGALRMGIVTRRVWREDELWIICTDPSAPPIVRDQRTVRE